MGDTDHTRWKKIEDLFLRALEHAPGERLRFLERECGDDRDLLQEVRALLEADASADPIDDIVRDAVLESLPDDAVDLLDRPIGNYRLIRILGEGGMGSVYLAERSDEQFEQQVAIKILNSYRPNRSLVQRFRAERQILANLDHPNIARLYDGGETDQGLPYLVMEYVAGEPVTDYCDRHKLSTRERLRLFQDICKAVQHAHQNLVIHRDIKPSNILVTADGVPKLLDFGIAKLLQPEDLQQTVAVTMESARLLTPGHASPEQVRGETITTATDVYSLGVLLYQLLTGRFPYEITSRRPSDIEHAICDSTPSRPSTRIAQTTAASAGSTTSDVSAARSTTTSRLVRQLRGDLDNIVLVAMRKEPDRRYPTVRQMQQDIDNYLHDRPVFARSDSLAYTASKFVRRNRWAVVATTAFIAAIVGLTTFYTAELATQRDVARVEANKANEVAKFLTDLFEEADPERTLGVELTPKQLLERGSARIANELAGQPEIQAALMATIGQIYNNLRDQRAAKAHLERSLQAAEAALGGEHPDVLRMRYLLGVANGYLGDLDAALEIHEANYRVQSRLNGERSLEAARELARIAFVRSEQRQYDVAEQDYREATQMLRDLGDEGSDELANLIVDYGLMLRTLDRLDEEEPMLLEALALQASRVGRNHPDYGSVLNNVATHYYRRGMFEDALLRTEELLSLNRKLYGEDGSPYGGVMSNYSSILQQLSRFDEALVAADKAIEILGAALGKDSARYAFVLENKANLLLEMKRYDEAGDLLERALGRMEEIFGKDTYDYVFTEGNYAGYLLARDRAAEAIPLLRHCVAVYSDVLGPENSQTAFSQMRLASALMETGQLDEAMDSATLALQKTRGLFPEPHRRLVEAIRAAATVHRERKEFDAADALFAEAIAVAKEIEDDPYWEIVKTEKELAESLIAQQRFARAEEMLLARHEQLSSMGDAHAPSLASTSESLQQLYLAWHKPERAADFGAEPPSSDN
jgi:serine/threonine-protein kinase